jgi:hypothetical protein
MTARYGPRVSSIETCDGDVVVFDMEAAEAWVQSDVACPLPEVR